MTKTTNSSKTKLTDVQRHHILGALLLRSNNGHLKRGDLSAVAAAEGIHLHHLSYLGPGQAGDGKQWPFRIDVTQWTTWVRPRPDSRASAGCPCRRTIHRELCCVWYGPYDAVCAAKFSLSHIRHESMLYDNMLNTVHVDEKIFYITQPTRRFLLLPGEEAPARRLRSKRFITRVMFLSAVGRPRYDPSTHQVFDGKLGIWPFVEQVPAQRSSARRPAGTIITKEISVTKTSYRYMLIANLLPALLSRLPSVTDGEPIVIQQDNAPAHIAADDAAFAEAAGGSRCNVVLRNQPPNSPDLNCNDL
ncbi:hypothetical protein KRP22_013482 [Phytophthora ramorum]|nr:hypothetical protein KRP22_11349 [Phytophthora ramorum]